MSKIKNISRAGWLVAGVVAALVLVPTVAVAAASVVTLEGSPSGHKADVTGANQLLTTTANPGSFFQNANAVLSFGFAAVATPPSGLALVVTTIHLDVWADPSPGTGNYVVFMVLTGTSCSGSRVGSYEQSTNPGSIGEIDVPLEPGLGIPSGDSLCGVQGGKVEAQAWVSGYTVPSGEVTSGPLHRVSAPPTQG